MRRDTCHLELPLFEPESLVRELAFFVRQGTKIGGNGNAENLRLGDHQKCGGVNRSKCARRQHRPLYALLPAFLDEKFEVGEITELWFVHCRLCADGHRLSNLGNHHTDLPRGHLYPRMLRYRENEEEFEAEAGHQHFRLVPRLPTEG